MMNYFYFVIGLPILFILAFLFLKMEEAKQEKEYFNYHLSCLVHEINMDLELVEKTAAPFQCLIMRNFVLDGRFFNKNKELYSRMQECLHAILVAHDINPNGNDYTLIKGLLKDLKRFIIEKYKFNYFVSRSSG